MASELIAESQWGRAGAVGALGSRSWSGSGWGVRVGRVPAPGTGKEPCGGRQVAGDSKRDLA